MSDTYSIDLVCSNCNYSGLVEIQKGKTVESALITLNCPTCGCSTLRKRGSMIKSVPLITERLPNPPVSPSIPFPFKPHDIPEKKRRSHYTWFDDKFRVQKTFTPTLMNIGN